MYAKNVFAAGALLSVVAAVPMVKRDIVWVTEIDEAIVTVPVTTTVWVNPGESIPTAAVSNSHYGHHRSHITTHVQSTVTVSPSAAPASTEESSVESSAPASSNYVAPTISSTEEAVPTTPSSTSVYVAPTTSVYSVPTTSSTSEYVAPTPTPSSTYVAPTTSSTSAAPAATSYTSDSSSSLTGDAASGTEYTGDLTWYDDGLGACGITSGPSDHIVAISETLFDEYTPTTGIHAGNPNDNALCGKTVTITGADGSPYTATIVDRCTGCKKQDLDLSEDFFNTVTNNGDGRVHNMSWKFD